MGYMDSSPHPLPDGWDSKRELNKLIKEYRRETLRMSSKSNDIAQTISYLIGFSISAILFGYDVWWIFGRTTPFLINFLFAAFTYGVFKKYSPQAITLTFIVCLLLIYGGVATPFLHLG